MVAIGRSSGRGPHEPAAGLHPLRGDLAGNGFKPYTLSV